MEQKPGQNMMEITASEEVRRGVFSNQVIVSHGAEEFHVDFIYMHPSGGSLNSRVIMTPGHFKRFVSAISENLSRYEAQYGVIKEGTEHGTVQ